MFQGKIAALNESETAYIESDYDKRIYTVEEIQDILGVSKTSAYNLVKSNVFHSVKIGDHYRISKKSFDKWLDGGNENE